MTADELGAMKRGSSGKVTLLPFGADPAKDLVNLTMSLKGFTAAFDSLPVPTAPAGAPSPAPAPPGRPASSSR